jgi:enamine deaminase RidA (YjgF/YER057c/UK114 family)
MFNVLQPEGWAPAKGYANGIEARGRMVFVAGKNYPAMTLVQVADLVEDRALVEIEVTAVVPE